MHSLVDDDSRLAYSEILPDEKGADLSGVPARARSGYFVADGITRIELLRTAPGGVAGRPGAVTAAR